MASRSARAVETGTGAGAAAAEVLEVEAGMTPGPTGPAGAAPGVGAAGGGVVGGPEGRGDLERSGQVLRRLVRQRHRPECRRRQRHWRWRRPLRAGEREVRWVAVVGWESERAGWLQRVR